MRYLITGGAGFIGSHIACRLRSEPSSSGHAIRILDNLSSGKRSNLEAIPGSVDFIECDIRDSAKLAAAMREVDVVFHQAALTSVPGSVKDPMACHEVNVTGTLAVLTAARDAGVRRLVFASSSSVYGENPVTPKSEGLLPDPLSPYALSKLAGEHYCHIFARLYGLETVVLRYFNVYGVRQDPNSQYAAVIPKFADAIRAGKSPTVFGDGEQTRDFVSVKDVAAANLLAASRPVAPGTAFNVGTGESVSLNQLLGFFARITGRDPKPVYGASAPGDIKHSLADISLIRRELGFAPEVTMDAGLREVIAWFLAKA